MKVYAVTGPARAGKDTFAQALIANSPHGGCVMHFADELKSDIAQNTPQVQAFYQALIDTVKAAAEGKTTQYTEVFQTAFAGWEKLVEDVRSGARQVTFPPDAPGDAVYTNDSNKEVPSAKFGGLSPRETMQCYGMFMRMTNSDDYWLSRLAKKLDDYATQHPDHIAVVPDVRFPNEMEFMRGIDAQRIHISRLAAQSQLSSTAQTHPSEAGLPFEPGDVTFYNDGSLEDVQKAAKNVLAGNTHTINLRTQPEEEYHAPFSQISANVEEMSSNTLLEAINKRMSGKFEDGMTLMHTQAHALKLACDMLCGQYEGEDFTAAQSFIRHLRWPAQAQDQANEIKNFKFVDKQASEAEIAIVDIARSVLLQATELSGGRVLETPTDAVLTACLHDWRGPHQSSQEAYQQIDWLKEAQSGLGGCSMYYNQVQNLFTKQASIEILNNLCKNESPTVFEHMEELQSPSIMPSRAQPQQSSARTYTI